MAASNNPRTRDAKGQSIPAHGAIAIDISSTDHTLATSSRYIYVATTGALKVDMIDGTTVTFAGLLAGTIYPFCVNKIYRTGTTIAGHALL